MKPERAYLGLLRETKDHRPKPGTAGFCEEGRLATRGYSHAFPRVLCNPKTSLSTTNPPTPVERVDGSPQLGLPSDLLSKPKALGLPIFGHGVLGVQNPVIFQCF